MSLPEQWIERELAYVRHLLEFILKEEAEAAAQIMPYIENLLSKPGKMLRPKLVIIGARIAGGSSMGYSAEFQAPLSFDTKKLILLKDRFKTRIKQKIVPLPEDSEYNNWRDSRPFPGALPNKIYLLAAAIEVLHMASLAHDDVIDNAPLRRGLPSAPSLLGNNQAVLAGDLLLTLCFTLVNEGASGSVAQTMSGMVRLMVRSELAQSADRKEFDKFISEKSEISRRHYLRVIGGKTALLFSTALCAGAGEMNGSQELIDQLQPLGIFMGLIFQMVDDILDFRLAPGQFGKLPGKDILDGQMTLPLIFALKNKNKEDLKKHIQEFRATKKGFESILKDLEDSGAFQKTRKEIDEFHTWALKHIKKLQDCRYDQSILEYLIDLIDFIMSRVY